MKFIPMNTESTFRRGRFWTLLVAILSLAISQSSSSANSLEGQNKGDTNTWSSVNLQGWEELDYIPFRVFFSRHSAGSQTITVDFPHLSGTTPGFQDLTSFTAFTPNIVFTAGPTLITDPSGVWTYIFTVNVTDNNPAEVRFFARLAAGAHINPGSSLQLRSTFGNVQIHKPGVGPGAPDLAILKTRPASVAAGGIITYTLSYTNQATTNNAMGVQISDILPPGVVVLTNSLAPNAHLVGNTIFWDLTNVFSHTSGQLSFQVQVDLLTAPGSVITNFSQILSSEDDASYADNTSIWLTTVTPGCTSPSITTDPTSVTNCAGGSVTFSVAASGTSPLSYQWRKDGTNIPGATTSSYTLPTLSPAQAGSYAAFVTNLCGSALSQSAVLSVTAQPAISCAGDKTVEIATAWTFDPPTANYPIVVLNTVTNTAGHCDGTFDATRIWQATDACGNSASCSQKVTVVDTTAPVITCSTTNKTIEFGAAWTFDAPTATDNSGTNTITIVSTVTNTAGHCGTTFDATRVWMATDACGNSASCSQKVTVVDTTAPVITCSNTNKTIELGNAWTFDAPTATDNSGTNTITIVSTVTNTAGHCGTTFDATRTWQATDLCGNSAQCSQKVTVVDTTTPVITCSNTNKTIEFGAAWTFDAPTATDNSGTNTISIVSTVTNTAGHCGIKGGAAMTGGVGHCADDRDRVSAAVVGRGRSVEGPGVAKFNRLVRGAAGNHRCGGINHSHLLAAGSAIAAGVGRHPHAGGIKGRAAMAGGVGHRANNRDRVSAAVVGRRRSVEGPGGAKFNRLVGVAAGNHRGSGVNHSHLLAAGSAVAAGVGGLPDASRIKGRAAMAGGVGHRANNSDRVSAAVVGRRRSVEGPGSAKFNRLVCVAAGNHRGGGINHGHFLAALSAVATSVSRLPGAGRIKGRAALAGGVGYRANNSDRVRAAVCGRRRGVDG